MAIRSGPRATWVLWAALFLLTAAGLSVAPRLDGLGFAAPAAAAEPDSAGAVASEADRRFQAARRARRVERFWIGVAAVYVPPLVLLVFGWAVAGVVRRLRGVRRH